MRHIALIGTALIAATTAAAQSADIPTPPLVPGLDKSVLVDPATFDISGVWEYASDSMSGLLEISQSDGAVTLTLVSGAVCSPQETCTLSGAVEDKALIVSTASVVDDEGGTASTAFALYFLSQTDALGTGVSEYIHPEGYEMNWDYEITMHRPMMKDGEWDPGVAQSRD